MTYEEMVKLAYEEIVGGIEKDASATDYLVNKSTFVKPGVQTIGQNLSNSVKNLFNKEQRLMGRAGLSGQYSNGPVAKSIRKHVFNGDGGLNPELKNRITNLKRDGLSYRDMSNDLHHTFR